MGAAWESTLEGGGRADSLRNFLPHGSAGITIVLSSEMGSHRENISAVKGSACEFIEADQT